MLFCMALSERVQQALGAAADLTKEEREDLVAELLLRLEADAEPEDGYDAAWATEIKRRVDAALTGKSPGIGWQQVRDEIRAELTRRRSA